MAKQIKQLSTALAAAGFVNKGLPDPDDPHLRLPIDRVAARVVGSGEHFEGFSFNTEELCSVTPIPMREFSNSGGSLHDYRGTKIGKLTVFGLATIEHNAGYLSKDRTLPTKANERKSRANYQGRNPQKRQARATGGARWVCKCICGNWTLRSTKGIRTMLNPSDWRTFEDACVQCRELDKRRNGIQRKL